MKKIFAIIILLCGIAGNSWAVCELSESTDRTQSDEDIYLSKEAHDTTRMALICQKGKCEDGEIIHVRGSHYKKNRLIENSAYYRCKLGGNDRWLEATVGDIPVSDERADLIVYDDDKEMFVYGKEASDGNYYTNVHYVKPDEKCGVKCTPENIDGYVYCDKDLWICQQSGFNAADRAPFGFCIYSDPQTRERYTVESEWTNYSMWSFWGATGLQDGESVDGNMSFCMGCKTGGFKGGDNKCYNKLDEAWCSWRKNIDGKNTEWKDDKCKCLDNGMEWSIEQHDCVKSGKGGKTGGSTGGSGSGTTGGSTGGKKTCEELHPNGSAERLACCRAGKSTTWTGTETSGTCSCVDKNKQWQYTAGARTGQCVTKTGVGNKTEVCGIKCNAQNSGKYFYCDNKIYWCSYDGLNGSFDLDDRYGIAGFCEYSEPAIRTGMLKTSSGNSGDNYIYEYKLDGTVLYNKITDYDGGAIYGNEKTKSLKNGGEITHSMSSGFCLGCASGFFYGSYSCHKSEDKAWCYWQKDNNLNTEWQNGECKCLDDGKVWDPKTHNCIVDNGAGGTGDGKKEDAVLTQEIKDAAARIDNFMKYAESNPSVWKNAEGKFNTARLASDATAGVILGTVGGIVSAKVIKKKQVEKGFDVLNCSIGGQKVADWGDEFRVGFGK